MLKKLVKYGNSNALVLDKAILELLNIAEGSVLKISTDGKSLILTPQKTVESQQVDEPYNNDQARLNLAKQEFFQRYENASEKSQEELIKLYKKLQDLHLQLSKNADFLKELPLLQQQFPDTTSPEFINAYTTLRGKFSPELINIEKELTSFENTHKLITKNGYKSIDLDDTQKNALQQEFAKTFTKNARAFAAYNAFLNNPDYQHEAQIIAEKYRDTQNSAEYMKAIEELQCKYSPETQQLRDELKAIGQKYSTHFQK